MNIKIGLKEWLATETPAEAFDFKEDDYYGKVKGMLSHTSTRKDKTDLSPQPKMVAMIKAL